MDGEGLLWTLQTFGLAMLLTAVLVVLMVVLSLWYMRPQQPSGFPPGQCTDRWMIWSRAHVPACEDT